MISARFIKSSLIYTVAGALPMASAIILLPFYIKSLSVELYGVLSLYLALTLICQILITFTFDTSIYIKFQELRHDPVGLRKYLSSVYAWMLLAGVILVSVSAAIGPIIFSQWVKLEGTHFFPYGFLSVATAVFQSMFKVHTSLLQAKEEPTKFFWSNLLSFSLIAVLTVAGLSWAPNSLFGPIGGRFLAVALSGTWALSGIIKNYGWHVHWGSLRSTRSFNVSSLIYQVQQWVINYLDRPILFLLVSLQTLGIYDFAFKCLLLIDLIMVGLHNSFYPRVIQTVMAQESKHTSVEVNRYYHGLIAVTMLLVTGAILVFPILGYTGIIRQGYEGAFAIIPYLAVTYLLKSVRYYFNFPYGALQYAQPLPGYYLFVTAVKFLLIFLLVPQWGIPGLVGAALTSSLLELLLLKHGLRSRFEFQFNAGKILIAPLFMAAVILANEVLFTQKWLAHLINMGVAISILLWLYRHEIRFLKWAKS